MRSMPDYGGYGASWRKATYREIPVEVPEILLKTAGPRSTVQRQRRGSFAGLGEAIEYNDLATGQPVGDPRNLLFEAGEVSPEPGSYLSITGGPEIYVPRETPNAEGDPVFTLPEEERTIASVETFGSPIDDLTQPENNWWLLLLVAAGLYLMTQGE